MIYDVRQTTSYAYASKVAYAHHLLRLTPIDRADQRVQAAALDIQPAPVRRREGRDFFGNRLTWIDLAEPHDRMVIKVAARAPVVDLVMLDPHNPRSVAYQLDRIEAHLAALPRHGEGRLSAPQQITAAAATVLRTSEAAAIDAALIGAAEDALMRLSEAIGTAYLTHNERAEPRWEALE